MAPISETARCRIAITGADGFVGQHLCAAFAEEGRIVVPIVRNRGAPVSAFDSFAVGDLTMQPDLTAALDDVDTVVHLAAMTHGDNIGDPAAFSHYRQVNVAATVYLAQRAKAAGVSRFVFMSSIKVNGERTNADAPECRGFSASSVPHPEDNYGESKLEAESALNEICSDGRMQLTILRPPLIYGPGNKGNMSKLMRVVALGIPLPFASITNRRSLIYVGNLADAVVLTTRPGQASGTFTLADVKYSTPELIRALAKALGVRARLFRFPRSTMTAICRGTGLRAEWERLDNSLLVDSSAFATQFKWIPRTEPHTAMQRTADGFRDSEL